MEAHLQVGEVHPSAQVEALGRRSVLRRVQLRPQGPVGIRRGAYLVKFLWAKITRHTLVKGWASPDDPALARYWETRRRRGKSALGRVRLRLLQAQRGRCPLCGDLLLYADHEPRHPDEWEQWITATGKAIRRQAIAATGSDTPGGRTVHHLVHTHCRARHPDGNRSVPAPPQLRS